jgi:hypothetical protein
MHAGRADAVQLFEHEHEHEHDQGADKAASTAGGKISMISPSNRSETAWS